ncbi:MAG: GTP-binding protein [Bacillota bacterium]|nr:GTP-binding protein [Bacillota bacterium]
MNAPVRIRRFRAADVKTLLARVREEVGGDALLLDLRREPPRWWERLAGRPGAMVATVALPPPAPTTEEAGKAMPVPPERPEPRAPAPLPGEPVWAEIRRRLERRGLLPELAARLAEPADQAEGEAPEATVRRRLLELLGPARPVEAGRQRRLVLVGPTGAGKTTTVAKLAGQMALYRGLEVGIVTLDAFRAGAFEQVDAYARAAGLTCLPAEEAGELRAALERLSAADLVLIDTTGRSPSDRRSLRRLEELVREARADAVLLTLSVTTRHEDLLYALEAYRRLGADRLLFTKMDEARAPGEVVNAVAASGLGVSYVAGGQRVPDDLAVFSPEALADELLGVAP